MIPAMPVVRVVVPVAAAESYWCVVVVPVTMAVVAMLFALLPVMMIMPVTSLGGYGEHKCRGQQRYEHHRRAEDP